MRLWRFSFKWVKGVGLYVFYHKSFSESKLLFPKLIINPDWSVTVKYRISF